MVPIQEKGRRDIDEQKRGLGVNLWGAKPALQWLPAKVASDLVGSWPFADERQGIQVN